MDCFIHPTAAAIGAYLECYDDASDYVAKEALRYTAPILDAAADVIARV